MIVFMMAQVVCQHCGNNAFEAVCHRLEPKSPQFVSLPDTFQSDTPVLRSTGEFIMFNKGVFAAVAMIGLSTAAHGADLPTTVPASVPAPAYYNWSGFYIGAQVGGAVAGDNSIRQFAALGGATIGNRNADLTGVIGGVHAGYNFQAHNWVYGVEADFEGSDASSGLQTLQSGDRAGARLNWLGSVRGRLGYAVDQLLIYGTGGLAYGEFDNRVVNGVTGVGQTFTGTRLGWTAGAGLEYAFQPNWTARIEYRYTEFDRAGFNPTVGTSVVGSSFRDDPSFHAVRAGISYKF